MFGQWFTIKFKHGIEAFEGFTGQVSISINLNNVGKKPRRNRLAVSIGFDARKEALHKGELACTAEFEDESVVGRVRMLEIRLARSEVEDFFC